jgi:hypothetical protein
MRSSPTWDEDYHPYRDQRFEQVMTAPTIDHPRETRVEMVTRMLVVREDHAPFRALFHQLLRIQTDLAE